MTLRGVNLFDIYGLVGALSTRGFVTAYILVSLAAPFYLRSLGRLTPTAVVISGLAVNRHGRGASRQLVSGSGFALFAAALSIRSHAFDRL